MDAPQGVPGLAASQGSDLGATRAAPQEAPAPILSSTSGSIGCEHRVILTRVQTEEEILLNSRGLCFELKAKDEYGHDVSLDQLRLNYTLLIRAKALEAPPIVPANQALGDQFPRPRNLTLDSASGTQPSPADSPPEWIPFGGVAKCGEVPPEKTFLGTSFEIQARIQSEVLDEGGHCPVFPHTVYSWYAEYRQGEDFYQGKLSDITPTHGYEDQWTSPLILSLIE